MLACEYYWLKTILMIGQMVYEGLQQQAYAVDWVKDGEAASLALAAHD